MIKENGGAIIVEHESICVIDSMPKAVIENNLADKILPLQDIPITFRKDGGYKLGKLTRNLCFLL